MEMTVLTLYNLRRPLSWDKINFWRGGKGERTIDSILRAADGNDSLDVDAFAGFDQAPREQAPLGSQTV